MESFYRVNERGITGEAMSLLDRVFLKSSFDVNGDLSLSRLGIGFGQEYAHKKVFFYFERGVIVWAKMQDGTELEFNASCRTSRA